MPNDYFSINDRALNTAFTPHTLRFLLPCAFRNSHIGSSLLYYPFHFMVFIWSPSVFYNFFFSPIYSFLQFIVFTSLLFSLVCYSPFHSILFPSYDLLHSELISNCCQCNEFMGFHFGVLLAYVDNLHVLIMHMAIEYSASMCRWCDVLDVGTSMNNTYKCFLYQVAAIIMIRYRYQLYVPTSRKHRIFY